MSLITRMLKQTAVYWPFVSTNQFGKKAVGSPIEIEVRWEDVSEEFLDSQGERQMSRSIVYVDRDTPVGGILMLGELGSGVDEANPKENDNAWEIRRFEKFPNLRVTEYLRKAIL